jgi:hypothetical protein
VHQIIGEPMLVHGLTTKGAVKHDVNAVLELVGRSPEHAARYPHELSGGQRQRVGNARAIGVHPTLIVPDEAVSALDVSVRAQILNLLVELRERLGLAYPVHLSRPRHRALYQPSSGRDVPGKAGGDRPGSIAVREAVAPILTGAHGFNSHDRRWQHFDIRPDRAPPQRRIAGSGRFITGMPVLQSLPLPDGALPRR